MNKKLFNNSHNMPHKKDSLIINKESLRTAPKLLDSQMLQNNDSVSCKSDKKRPNPWQEESVSKRCFHLQGDNIDTSIGQKSQGLEPMILSVKSQLSPELCSRLEEALSHILKSIKDLIPVKEISVNEAQNVQCLIKQIISERIHRLMLDKPVDSYMEIVTAYREQFPLDTDQDMLKTVSRMPSTKYIQADTAEKFFELNLENILQSKLDEMFGKLEEIYSESRDTMKENDMRRSPKNTFEINQSPTYRYDDIEKNDSSNNGKMSYLERYDYILHKLLRKMSPYLTQIMNMDFTHESKIADIVLKTDNFRSSGEVSEKDTSNQVDTVFEMNKENTLNEESMSNASENSLPASTLYYVKVIGRPTLPIKETMQTFLDQFKPKCVKKHRKQHNLLFLGFTEKINHDNIISKNGVTIGECVIEVKASEPSGNMAGEKITNNNINKSDITQCEDAKTHS